jgi:alpha-tubulin suppressor-like RCC1 family protein
MEGTMSRLVCWTLLALLLAACGSPKPEGPDAAAAAGPDASLLPDAGCLPACSGKSCGDDGCGSTCGSCLSPKTCVGGQCVVEARCDDGVKNGDETDVDCGGSCGPCPLGAGCLRPADCQSELCRNNLCEAPPASCQDKVKNGTETDVDCGGDLCPPCDLEKRCAAGGDCLGHVCRDGACRPAQCGNKLRDADELDVDCGGPCGPCDAGQICSTAADCLSNVCPGGHCAAATCMDAVLNGTETDVDCGGAICPGCAVGQRCLERIDCQSGRCIQGVCQRRDENARIALGGTHACFVTAQGKVKCWGSNAYANLGDGTTTDRHRPVDVVGLPDDIVAVAATGGTTCALTSAGADYCWGVDAGMFTSALSQCQVSIESYPCSPTPVLMPGLEKDVMAITDHCALLASGEVRCWGPNYKGENGDGTNDPSPKGFSVKTLVPKPAAALGDDCALTGDEIWCWGSNNSGKMGINADDGPDLCGPTPTIDACAKTPVKIGGLDGQTLLASHGGSFHNCVLTGAGQVYCWGANSDADLGTGSTTSTVVPTKTDTTATFFAMSSNCAIAADTNVWCWGTEVGNVLPDVCGAAPYQVPCSLKPIQTKPIATGAKALSTVGNTCVIANDDSVWCWGSNDQGQLGDGTTDSSVAPVKVQF